VFKGEKPSHYHQQQLKQQQQQHSSITVVVSLHFIKLLLKRSAFDFK